MKAEEDEAKATGAGPVDEDVLGGVLGGFIGPSDLVAVSAGWMEVGECIWSDMVVT